MVAAQRNQSEQVGIDTKLSEAGSHMRTNSGSTDIALQHSGEYEMSVQLTDSMSAVPTSRQPPAII